MSEENGRQLDAILDQLRIQNRLTVVQLLRIPGLTQADIIVALASTGAPAKEIARLLGTTVGTVQVAVSRQKKRRKGDSS
jgi:DNA-binding NarL/FixJ family response regulator